MPVVSEARLRDLCYRILIAMRTPPDIAETVTDVLVKADVRGMDSHGSRLLDMYVTQLQEGRLDPAGRVEIRQDGAIASLEGHWGFGHVGARLAAQLAVEAAQKYGIGAASLVHVLHIGRLGDYAEYIAEHGMIGMVMCNANRATTPFGATMRVFGTNPIALGIPRRDGKYLVSDFATSTKSINRLKIYIQHEDRLPEGIILDKDGYPTTDPHAFFAGGMLLPAGGYKGYALNMFVDIIGGALVGAGCASLLDVSPGNGTLIIAIDVGRWRPLHEFTDEVERLCGVIKGAPLAPESAEVLLPGELEVRATEQRRARGIPFDDQAWETLRRAWSRVGLPINEFTE